MQPFINYHIVHESESTHHENDLWYEFENEIKPIFEVNGIDTLQQDAKTHMNHTDDY
jgi:hypothetical protein